MRTTLHIIQQASTFNWNSLINQFLEKMKKNDLSVKTINAYKHDLSLFVKWIDTINPLKNLQALTEIDIIEYRQHLINSDLKAATINRRIGSIQRLCRWAVEYKLLKEDVSKVVKQINITTRGCPIGLKTAEVQRLLQTAGQSKHGHSKRNYALLHLMLQTGLRVNEVAELKLKDIELGERSGMVTIRLGKGRKTRTIPLNSKARRALKLYLNSKNREESINSVFMSERQTALSTRSIQSIITELAKRANISRIRVSPHTLRHTFAINYLKQNPSNIVQLANLMGHESLDTTAIYTQPSMEDLADNLELMAKG
jgi:integrase/recombinase XerC